VIFDIILEKLLTKQVSFAPGEDSYNENKEGEPEELDVMSAMILPKTTHLEGEICT
jgi:hypothetical protein